MEGGSPTVRLRRLGQALRGLREDAGLTGDQAGSVVERSGSWISRIESGRAGLRSRELRDLLTAYGVHDPRRREELEALAREGKERGWWHKYVDALTDVYATYVGLEAEATSLLGYEDAVVPGLLQTEDYSRALYEQTIPPLKPGPAVIEARVQVRMQRQRMLIGDRARQLWFVIDESVLRRSVGRDDVFRDQLFRLRDLVTEGRIDLRVVPLHRSTHLAGVRSFTILEFAQDPSVVYIETQPGGAFEYGEAVDQYRKVFEHVTSIAHDREETARLLDRLAQDLRSDRE